jgi:hypothetical protein
MTVSSFYLISCFALAVIFFLYRKSIEHKRKLAANIPEITKLPWGAMITHLFSNDKGSNYSELGNEGNKDSGWSLNLNLRL